MFKWLQRIFEKSETVKNKESNNVSGDEYDDVLDDTYDDAICYYYIMPGIFDMPGDPERDLE
ncbi:hypothetical protein [Thermodesulfovibrio hydrogeniphilus]